MTRTACIAATFLLAMVFAASVDGYCWPLSEQANVTYKNRPDKQFVPPPIQLVLGGWDSQVISTEIARILLAERLGIPVEMWPTDDLSQYWDKLWEQQVLYGEEATYDAAIYKAMANTTNLAYLETWNENNPKIVRMLFEDRTVQSLGGLGTSGREGFYVPAYLTDQYPSLFSYQAYKNGSALLDLFKCNSLGLCETDKPTLWFSSSTYTDAGQTERLLKNVGMPFYVNYTGSDAALDEVMFQFMEQKLPFFFYSYRPYWIHHTLKLTRVMLPPNSCDCDTAQCYLDATCDWGIWPLNKAASAQLEELSPEAFYLLRSLTLNNEQVESILTNMHSGMTMSQATCVWLKDHQPVWETWIKPILRFTCVKDCVHGQCVDTQCVCTKGYRGSDCSEIYKLEGHALDVSYTFTLWILGAVIVLVGAWTSLIILEHAVIPSRISRRFDHIWVIPSALCLALAGDWCMTVVIASSVELELPLQFHWLVFLIGPAASSVLTAAAFWLARMTITTVVPPSAKYEDAENTNMEAAQSSRRKQKNSIRQQHLSTSIHPLMFACGLLLTLSSTAQHFSAVHGLQIDADIEYSAGLFVLALVLTYITVTIASIFYFHVIGSRLRLLGFFIMGFGLLTNQLVLLLSITFIYREGQSNDGSGGVSDAGIRMCASACVAITCFVLMLLNVNRLKLSRTVLNHTLREMEAHLNTVKERMQHDIDWHRSQLDLINLTRPMYCKNHWLLQAHANDLIGFPSTGGGACADVRTGSCKRPTGSSSQYSISIPGSLADSGSRADADALPLPAGHRENSKGGDKESKLNFLRELLDNPVCVEYIKDIMHKRVCVEMIEFYLEVQRYKQITDGVERTQRALHLYEWYVKEGAQLQVNVSDALRQGVDGALRPIIQSLDGPVPCEVQSIVNPSVAMSERRSSVSRKNVGGGLSINTTATATTTTTNANNNNNNAAHRSSQSSLSTAPLNPLPSSSSSNTSPSPIINPNAGPFTAANGSTAPSSTTNLLSRAKGGEGSASRAYAPVHVFDECEMEVLQLIQGNGFSEFRDSPDFAPCFAVYQLAKLNNQWLPSKPSAATLRSMTEMMKSERSGYTHTMS